VEQQFKFTKSAVLRNSVSNYRSRSFMLDFNKSGLNYAEQVGSGEVGQDLLGDQQGGGDQL